MTLFQLLPGSWLHLMPQGQQGGLFSALDFPDSGGSEKVCQVVHSFPVGSWDQVSGAEIRQL